MREKSRSMSEQTAVGNPIGIDDTRAEAKLDEPGEMGDEAMLPVERSSLARERLNVSSAVPAGDNSQVLAPVPCSACTQVLPIGRRDPSVPGCCCCPSGVLADTCGRSTLNPVT